MATVFMGRDFLLNGRKASDLYHDYAAKMPIFDYHSHLSSELIAEDHIFSNLAQVWLAEDHYKWRAMRANGVSEDYITGRKHSDRACFLKWAETTPYTMRNQLYHWTHLELQRYFGIKKLLNADTAKWIYDKTSEMLNSKAFSARNLLRKMNVKVVCTTDDPIDSLKHHRAIKKSGFEIKVLPCFRPERLFLLSNLTEWNAYVDKLAESADIEIKSYDNLLDALKKRHTFFHNAGCCTSDISFATISFAPAKGAEIKRIFSALRSGKMKMQDEIDRYKTALLLDICKMNSERGWVQQFHINVIRNNNSRMFRQTGPDSGFDSINDSRYAVNLASFLDALDNEDKLAKTILYSLNPSDNEMLVTMAGNFQTNGIPGKIQYGAAWWFLDQKDGLVRHLNALSAMGLLSRFVGMLTDSRSFLSFPRHEYFRRVLCNILGSDIENGELPDDMAFIGGMVQDISYRNAENYFGIKA